MSLGGGGIKIPNKDKEKEKSSRFLSRTQLILESKITLNFIMLVPFIMLMVSTISCVIPNLDSVFILLSNMFGYSLITNLYFLFYAYKHKFCIYSKISIITLLVLNILNITHTIINLGAYYEIYDQTIAFIGVVLTIIFAIKERKNK